MQLLNKQSNFSQLIQVKTKYFGQFEGRLLCIEASRQAITIAALTYTNRKDFAFKQIIDLSISSSLINLSFSNHRTYEISCNNLTNLYQMLQKCRDCAKITIFREQVVLNVPQFLNYKMSKKEMWCVSGSVLSEQKDGMGYGKRYDFLKRQDWKRNEKKGGLIFINERKKENQSKIISFVVKKFLKTGSFMGISFPVFAMKPESILQTYCKGLGCASTLLNVNDHLQRFKMFLCFLLSMSFLLSDLDKPFNPTIGETHQARIAGGLYSAEQISHHPPVSAFHYQTPTFTISAALELSANIGLNSATGHFIGDITADFKDGQRIVGRLNNGFVRGFIIGDLAFSTCGAFYAYDQKNHRVCTLESNQDNYFKGQIGVLNFETQQKFASKMKDPDRFFDFNGISPLKFTKIESIIEIEWGKVVSFDSEVLMDFERKQFWPYEPTRLPRDKVLLSDSTFRKDIRLRKEEMMEESQNEKEKIENEERRNQGLRKEMAKH